MQDHLGDALLRFEFARNNFRAAEVCVDDLQLGSHVNGARKLTAEQQDQAAELLDEHADRSEKYSRASLALAAALRVEIDAAS